MKLMKPSMMTKVEFPGINPLMPTLVMTSWQQSFDAFIFSYMFIKFRDLRGESRSNL